MRLNSEESTLSLNKITHSNSAMDILNTRAIELKRKNIERFEK